MPQRRSLQAESGAVGPVIFDNLPTWLLIAEGAVSERLVVCRTQFFHEFRLFDVRSIDPNVSTVAAANRKWLKLVKYEHF